SIPFELGLGRPAMALTRTSIGTSLPSRVGRSSLRLGIPVQAQAYPSLRCGCRGWSRPAAPSISSICVLGGAAARGSSRGSRDARRRSHPAATRRRAEGAQAVKVKGEKDE
ncbi:unnamed protein product, partial [Durusdinium trenchii]